MNINHDNLGRFTFVKGGNTSKSKRPEQKSNLNLYQRLLLKSY